MEERQAREKMNADSQKIREDNKKRRLPIDQSTDFIEKAKHLNEKTAEQEQKRLLEEQKEEARRILLEKKQVEDVRKANALRKAEAEFQKNMALRKEEEETRHDDEPRKLVSTKAFSSLNQKIQKSDESFTAIKRNVNPKVPAAAGVDILKLVESVKHPLAISKYPIARPAVPARPVYSTSHHLPKQTSLIQSPPPPPPPAPAPVSTSPVIRNTPVSTTTLVDPRIRHLLPPPPPPLQQQQREVFLSQEQHTALEPITIKRQLSNPKDPRMNADNVKKIKLSNSTALSTPFRAETLLYNGSKFIASVVVEGKQTCYHESQIMKLITYDGQNEIRAMYTVPLKALNIILSGRPISFMNIIPKDNLIYVSKLKSYYQVNEMAGVIHHADMKKAIVLLAEEDLKKLSNLPADTGLGGAYTRLCAIFIDDLVERPKCLTKEISYEADNIDYTVPYSWNLVAEYLKFPEELLQLKNKARFLVYGASDTSHMLTRASQALKAVQHSTASYVMMFDRYGEMYFSRNLTKHKKEAATRMWEFGVPDFSYSEMIPAIEIFPNNSGGFVTTDMKNIVSNPLIIQSIQAEIKKLNSMPTVYGQWSFILPHNWLCHLKKTIIDTESGERAKQAIVNVTIALSNNCIQILKLWCAETEDINYIHYMDRVAHKKYKTHQYFVYVDDIGSVSSTEYINSIEFVQSSTIYSTFA